MSGRRTVTVMITLHRLALAVALAAASASLPAAHASPAGGQDKLIKDAALMMLKEGNARYVAGKTQHPNEEPERRHLTASEGQEPFATILGCSDSRDPVELIFDRGVGDLFVVRVAGNVAGEDEMATIEYGAEHLGSPLLVVMGHTKCGAVTAVATHAQVHGHLPNLAAHIQRAAANAEKAGATGEGLIRAAITANVWVQIEDLLKNSEIVRNLVRSGKVSVVGAVYDIDSGKVDFLGAHPELATLLGAPAATEPAKEHATAEPVHGGAAPELVKGDARKVKEDLVGGHAPAAPAKPEHH